MSIGVYILNPTSWWAMAKEGKGVNFAKSSFDFQAIRLTRGFVVHGTALHMCRSMHGYMAPGDLRPRIPPPTDLQAKPESNGHLPSTSKPSTTSDWSQISTKLINTKTK